MKWNNVKLNYLAAHYLVVKDLFKNITMHVENSSTRISSNSEAFAAELQDNPENYHEKMIVWRIL